MAGPCGGSATGCLGSPASCCSGRRCSTPPTTSGQRRSPEPPPKATRLDPLHPTKNSDHVTVHWSLISGRKSHHSRSSSYASHPCTPTARSVQQTHPDPKDAALADLVY